MKKPIRQLEVAHHPQNNRFFIDLPNGMAYLDYQADAGTQPPVMEFTHTFVSENLRNQGIGTQLIEAGLDYAMEKGFNIKPTCPFVGAYLETHPEFAEAIV